MVDSEGLASILLKQGVVKQWLEPSYNQKGRRFGC